MTVDSCGNVLPTSDIHTVTLSGSSCSTGSGTWQTPTGSGLLAQQSKTTPNVVTSNPTTAHYKIDDASYIAVDHLSGPTPCITYQYGYPVAYPLIYKGDAFRGSALFGSGYRTQQSLIAIPGAAHSTNPFQNTGATRNYSLGSPANGPNANLDSTPLTSDIYTGPYAGKEEDNAAWIASYGMPTAKRQHRTCNSRRRASHTRRRHRFFLLAKPTIRPKNRKTSLQTPLGTTEWWWMSQVPQPT